LEEWFLEYAVTTPQPSTLKVVQGLDECGAAVADVETGFQSVISVGVVVEIVSNVM
jgi:hypothetical protein